MKYRNYQLSHVDCGDFTIAGYSVAGEESLVIVPELDCTLDIGKCPREALTVNNVLISHGHMDHVAGLPYYFAQRDFQGIPVGTAVVPADLAGPLEDLMQAFGRVEGHVAPYRLVGVRDGYDYEIRRGLVARAFNVRHRHPAGALGYSLIDVRNKLKDEFLGLVGPQIVELKNKGVEITHRVEYPLVAYLGDTDNTNYSDLPHVANAKVLLVEVTFFEADHVSRAREGRHVHVLDLPAMLEGMKNEKVVIIHVTRRTNLSAARAMLKAELPAQTLERVTFLMGRKYIEED
jgi:ribonuclease Z